MRVKDYLIIKTAQRHFRYVLRAGLGLPIVPAEGSVQFLTELPHLLGVHRMCNVVSNYAPRTRRLFYWRFHVKKA